LRQADNDLTVYQREQEIEEQIVSMTRDALAHGTASNDQLLQAQDTLDGVVATLENERALRETYEHAIAVLEGVAPSDFAISVVPDYAFPTPGIPLALPSQMLERRPDVVSAERTAASANARIGVAEAAFFPTLDLTANASLVATTLPRLLSVPTRVWSLGPSLAQTIFDGGARSAEVQSARASYDEDVAQYRLTVLTAFQNVEDSLSEVRHVGTQGARLDAIYRRNEKLYQSILAQQRAGTASPQDVLNARLTLEQARQNWEDTESQLAQDTVSLIKNLGGGWDGATGDKDGASGPGAQQSAGEQPSERPTSPGTN